MTIIIRSSDLHCSLFKSFYGSIKINSVFFFSPFFSLSFVIEAMYSCKNILLRGISSVEFIIILFSFINSIFFFHYAYIHLDQISMLTVWSSMLPTRHRLEVYVLPMNKDHLTVLLLTMDWPSVHNFDEEHSVTKWNLMMNLVQLFDQMMSSMYEHVYKSWQDQTWKRKRKT